jgi:hypothetical protein
MEIPLAALSSKAYFPKKTYPLKEGARPEEHKEENGYLARILKPPGPNP